MDRSQEVGGLVAFLTYLRQTKADQANYIAEQFGRENVKTDEQGEPLVRVTDPGTRKQKWIPLNASGLSFNDAMLLTASFPQMAGAAAGLIGARKIPGLGALKGGKGFLRDVTAGAIGSESVAAGEQLATEAYDKLPVEWKSTLTERAKAVPADMAMDYAMAGMAKPLRVIGRGIGAVFGKGEFGLGSPLAMFRGAIQNDAIAAQKFIKDKTGIHIPLSAGESSGLPWLAQTEEYLYHHPAGARPILNQREAEDSAKRAFQEYMIEPMTLSDDETVGRKTIQLLDELKQSVSSETRKAADAATEKSQNALFGLAASTGKATPEKEFGKVGDKLRSRVTGLRDAAKARQQELRDKVSELEGGTGKVFESENIGLQESARRQLKALPAPEQTIKESSGLLDEFGKPMEVTKTGTKIEREFVPDKVVARLESLTKSKKYSLSDLIQMRSDVYEDIAAGQAVPNTGTHYLNEIGKMLSEAINQGVEGMPSGELKTALQAANKQYKEEVLPFSEKGLAQFFPKLSERGFTENTDLVSRFMREGEEYGRLVSTIGKDSPEHKQVKRAIFDQMLRDSSDNLDGSVIDAKALMANLKAMATNPKTRPVFDDVFGNVQRSLTQQAELLGKIEDLTGGKLPREELEAILSGKSPASLPLRDLALRWKKEQEVYKNGVIRKLVAGELEPGKIKSEEFIDKFLDSADYSDVAQAWGHLASDPSLQDQIRRKLTERVFKRAARPLEPGDIPKLMTGERTHVVSSTGIQQALGDAESQKKLEMIIGRDRMDLLRAQTSLQAARDWAEEQAGNTGMFVRGNAIGSLLRFKGGLTHEVEGFIKYKLLGVLISSSRFNKILESHYTPQEIPWLAKAIVTSQPFIDAVVEDSASNNIAFNILRAAKQFAGLAVSPSGKEGETKTKNARPSAEEFFPAPTTLKPAIRVNGKVFTGKDHVAAYANAKSDGQPDTSGAEEGFVDSSGQWHNRQQAARSTGLETNTEPGKLHSSDLPRP